MTATPLLVEETNLSTAWCKIVDHATKSPTRELTPLLLTLTDFGETQSIREILDADLKKNNETSIDTVSETIFPDSLYKLFKHDRQLLYEEYKKNLPRIRKLDARNRRGTYFERLINFNGESNQLEIIINSILNDPGVRRSKLQASIFDPMQDHLDTPYQGFPCLQHVTFYVTADKGLVLNSFYAIQLLYRKAYGNWLGIINLGKFMANELNLKFERFNCFVGVEQLEITKTSAKTLLSKMND